MKFDSKAFKPLLIFIITLILIIVFFIVGYNYFTDYGRKSLHKKPVSIAPKIQQIIPKDELPGKVEEVVPVIDSVDDDETGFVYNGIHYKYNEDILTFLIMGVDIKDKLPNADKVKDYMKGGQADALFLLVIDPHTEAINLVAINRNSMAEIDIYDKDNNFVRTDYLQICLQHGFGSGLEDSCERQVEAVSRMFYDLPIHGYVSIGTKAISILNNAVGGVTVEVMDDIPGSSRLKKGNTVTLKGEEALLYLTERDMDEFDSSTKRLARQKQYLSALAKEAIAKTKSDITFPLTVLDKTKKYTVTDVSASEITFLATNYLNYNFMPKGIISPKGETIVGTGDFEEFLIDENDLFELMLDLFYEKSDN